MATWAFNKLMYLFRHMKDLSQFSQNSLKVICDYMKQKTLNLKKALNYLLLKLFSKSRALKKGAIEKQAEIYECLKEKETQ